MVIRNGNAMTFTDLQVPENSCAYEEYDPTHLTPLNQSTVTRLNELDWSADLFHNKSVLDIGCNSGILSLYANKLGAKSVKAVDVQTPFIDFLSSVVSLHKLPIQVEKIGFNELKAETHAADVVLFMEVLHWIVDQNGTVEDAIYKLATLTGETLYLETPWDTKEPSIAKKGVIQEEQYNIELILKQLQKYFTNVQVVRFMTYFGDMENSKRILIKASGKREDFESMRGLTDVNPLNISLKRGHNAIQLMSSTRGPVVLKKLPHESMLPRLDTESANAFFSLLEAQDGPLLPAYKIDRNYIYTNALNEHLMLSPFVGDLADHFGQHTNHAPVTDPLRLAVECRRNLRHIPENLVQAIKDTSQPITLNAREDLGIFFNHLIDTHGLTTFIDDVYTANAIADRTVEDAVIHNDLQLGNMITDSTGKDWILDLDILRSGTAYSDFICCAIYNNSPKESVQSLYIEMVDINGREIHMTDMYFAMNILLKWIYVLNTHHKSALASLGEHTVNGIKTLHTIVMEEQSEQRVA